MHYFPPAEILGAHELLYSEWCQEVSDSVDRLLDKHLSASNMRLHLTCPEDEVPASFMETDDTNADAVDAGDRGKLEEAGGGDGDQGGGDGSGGAEGVSPGGSWEVDAWFGTRYRVRDIAEGMRKRAGDWYSHLTDAWSSWPCLQGVDKDVVGGMALPPHNKYISEEQTLVQAPSSFTCEPSLVVETPTIKGWHLLDVSLGAPRAAIFLSLNSPIVDESPRSAALLRLLLEVLELSINEQRYLAEEAGIGIDISNYCFSSPCYGLRLLLHGFSAHLPLLLQDVVGQLAELSITQEVFAMAKEKAETDYRNRKYQQPFLHSVLSNHQVLENLSLSLFLTNLFILD